MNRRLFWGGIAAAGTAGLVAGRVTLGQGVGNAHELPAEITGMSASMLSSAIKNKYVSCKDVIQAYLAHIHKYNPTYKEIHWPKSINDKRMDTYHRWMEVVIGGSLAGLPVANVPVGFDKEGRPMGMQIIGPHGADQSVLEFAMSYEAVTDHLNKRPNLVAG